MVKQESENLKKLREIVKEIEVQNFGGESSLNTTDTKIDYFKYGIGGNEVKSSNNQTKQQKLTHDIDDLIHEEMNKINSESNKECKLKSYECLFESIINMIENKKAII